MSKTNQDYKDNINLETIFKDIYSDTFENFQKKFLQAVNKGYDNVFKYAIDLQINNEEVTIHYYCTKEDKNLIFDLACKKFSSIRVDYADYEISYIVPFKKSEIYNMALELNCTRLINIFAENGLKVNHEAKNFNDLIESKIKNGEFQSFKALVDKVEDVSMIESYLNMAVRKSNSYEVCDYLIKRLKLINKVDFLNPKLVCDTIIFNRNDEIIKLIINHCEINGVNLSSATPLHEAIHYKKPEIVNLLLQKGADPYALNCTQSNALVESIGNNPECTKILLEFGVDPNKGFVRDILDTEWGYICNLPIFSVSANTIFDKDYTLLFDLIDIGAIPILEMFEGNYAAHIHKTMFVLFDDFIKGEFSKNKKLEESIKEIYIFSKFNAKLKFYPSYSKLQITEKELSLLKYTDQEIIQKVTNLEQEGLSNKFLLIMRTLVDNVLNDNYNDKPEMLNFIKKICTFSKFKDEIAKCHNENSSFEKISIKQIKENYKLKIIYTEDEISKYKQEAKKEMNADAMEISIAKQENGIEDIQSPIKQLKIEEVNLPSNEVSNIGIADNQNDDCA